MASEYRDKLATCLWRELRHIYPDLAPADERTLEERKKQAEQDEIDLFGPEEKENETCPSKD